MATVRGMTRETRHCTVCSAKYTVSWPGTGPEPKGYDDGLCGQHSPDITALGNEDNDVSD